MGGPGSRGQSVGDRERERERGTEGEACRVLRLLEVKVYVHEEWDCFKHCRRGRCLSSAALCVCEPDWVGRQCDSFLRTDSRFLPPWIADGRLWWQHEAVEQASRALAALQYPQHPHACAASLDRFTFHNVGLGGSISYVAGLLSLSFSRNRTMLIQPGQEWVYAPKACHSGGFDCVFEPWTNCSSDERRRRGREEYEVNVFSMPHTVVEHYHWLPPQFRHLGFYFWRAMTTKFLFRMSAEYSTSLELEHVRRRLGWPPGERAIGLHVRLGDSCKTNIRRNKCVALERHVAEVRAVAGMYGLRSVFVATDGADVVARTRAMLGDGFRVYALSEFEGVRGSLHNGSRDGVYIESRLASGLLDRCLRLRLPPLPSEVCRSSRI